MDPEKKSDLNEAFFFFVASAGDTETNILQVQICCVGVHDSLSAGNYLGQLDNNGSRGSIWMMVSTAFCCGATWDQLQEPENDQRGLWSVWTGTSSSGDTVLSIR